MNVTVVGGGVVGLAAAYYLARHGAAVRVLEARRIGSGASYGNGGWITPTYAGPLPAKGLLSYTLRSLGRPDSPVYLAPRADPELVRWAWRFWRCCTTRAHGRGLHAAARLGEHSQRLYDELAADGVSFERFRDGLLVVSIDPAVAAKELEHLRAFEAYGYKVPELTDVHEHEPFLSDRVTTGFVVEEESHVDPVSVTRGLASAIESLGGEILEGAEVTGIDGHRLRTTAGVFESDKTLLAAGAWTTGLGRALGVRIPMQAGKGYSFSTAATPPARPVHLLDAKVAVTPLPGRVRFAGTMEISGVNLDIRERRVDAIVRGARRFVADWPDEPVAGVWTGMRPVAPDGLPILGAVPGFQDLYVATGHSMCGMTLAPASGQAMAELILTGTAPPVLDPFGLSRFHGR